MRRHLFVATLAACVLSACGDQGEERAESAPTPAALTREAIGYYCNMIVVDHLGPKGQIFVDGRADPVWFTSVRDAIVFTLLPEEPKNITAVYVNDMGRASWDRPEPGTWIDARKAWYVIGSEKMGGMGAPEAVPFAEHGAAKSFARRHGGRVVELDDVPRDYVLSDASESMPGSLHQGTGNVNQAAHAGTDADMPMQHAHEHRAQETEK